MKDIIIELPDSLNFAPSPNTSTYYLKGATFTPSVDSDGNLSWTNDGGLPNPPTVNIKGPSAGYDDSQIRTYIASIPRPNLADNWYFKNPVNQREVSGTIVTTGYFIDRWILQSGSVTISENGLTLNGTIEQKYEQSFGDNVLGSILFSDGTIAQGVYNNEDKIFSVTASNKTIVAVKLEIGTYQTLARKVDTTWVLNEIPDFGEQLEKCQRYYTKIKGNAMELPGMLSNGSMDYRGTVFLPVPMRTNPVIMNIPIIVVRHQSGYSGRFNYTNNSRPDNATIELLDNNSYARIDFLVNAKTDNINNIPIAIEIMSDFALSADL